MERILTQRLVLRLPKQSDSRFILDLYSGEDFKRFVGDKNLHTEEDAWRYIESAILNMHKTYGVCLLLVEERASGQPVGVCGLIKRDTLESMDLGYGFAPQYYGFGYGYESGRAVLNYAKDVLKQQRMLAITSSNNVASKALLSKLGFTYIKVEKSLDDNIDIIRYELKW